MAQADTLQEIEVTAQRITLDKYEKPQDQVKDGTEPSVEEAPTYKYPLTINSNFPAYITFTARKIDGVDMSEVIGEVARSTKNFVWEGVKTVNPLLAGAIETVAKRVTSEQESEADKDLTDKEKKDIIEAAQQQLGVALNSHKNNSSGTKVGTVMLPLQQSLTFEDGVLYNEANLGIAGASLGAMAQSKNPFEGALKEGGQFSRAAAGIVANTVATNIGTIAGLIAGATKGLAASAFGGVAGAGLGEGVGAAVKNATRVTTNPNQRTLFEKVNLRQFSFTFKMIANNAKEAQQVKNIVKFFRQEVYPEAIVVNDVSLAYEFPNVFDIKIKNFTNDEDNLPAPKIQRCYLQSVQTVYNATANSMHVDGSFVEVDITLNFREIVALDKNKVKDENY